MRLRKLSSLVGMALFLATLGQAEAQDTAPPASEDTAQDSNQASQDPPASDDDGSADPADGSADDAATDGTATDGTEDIEGVPEESVFAGLRSRLRMRQSHLNTDGDAGWSLGTIIAALVLAYVMIVLGVLALWRRARDPEFRRLRTESQGEGRWTTFLGYAIRRKIDAVVTLRLAKVEPPGCGAQLVYLVNDEVKGRLSEGGEGKVEFHGLKPKSFWQSDAQESLRLGFELIQPRDRKITLHLDVRSEYQIGKSSGGAGLFQENLVFEPSVTGKPLEVLAAAPTPGFDSIGAPSLGAPGLAGGLDETGGFGLPGAAFPAVMPGSSVDSGQLDQVKMQQSELQQRLEILESRVVGEGTSDSEIEHRMSSLKSRLDELARGGGGPSHEIEQRLQHLESQAASGSSIPPQDLQQLRQEMRAAEERAAKALRENLQVVVNNMKTLRAEGNQLNSAVNDLMQRFVNSERRVAELAKRLPDGTDLDA